MSFLGLVLILSGYPYKRKRKDHGKIKKEDSHLQAKETGP